MTTTVVVGATVLVGGGVVGGSVVGGSVVGGSVSGSVGGVVGPPAPADVDGEDGEEVDDDGEDAVDDGAAVASPPSPSLLQLDRRSTSATAALDPSERRAITRDVPWWAGMSTSSSRRSVRVRHQTAQGSATIASCSRVATTAPSTSTRTSRIARSPCASNRSTTTALTVACAPTRAMP